MAEIATVKSRTKKSSKPSLLGRHRIFKDKLFIGFMVATVALCIVICLILLIRVRPRDFVVPLQYSTLQGFDALGVWYRVFGFGAFSLVVTFGNIAMAAYGYEKSRLASFLLVVSSLMVNLFTLIIVLTLVSHLEL